MRLGKLIAVATLFWACALVWVWRTPGLPAASSVVYAAGDSGHLDRDLAAVLSAAEFTGRFQSTLFDRRHLGRRLNRPLADLGNLLFFDNILALHEDNSCAGCHSPGFGFGDSQSIAIGTQNNGIVGPDRTGPRNQRKAPIVTNSAFIPKLMLNGRFVALSGNPFDNSAGFGFPPPEGEAVLFGPGDANFPTLLSAQGHVPQTELVEMAGFTGANHNTFFDPKFWQFDDGKGTTLPPDTVDIHDTSHPDGSLNEEIRSVVLGKIRNTTGYVTLFKKVFRISSKNDITFAMVGQALSEFQISLTFANAPIDQFARGDYDAMTEQQKRGALLFFGEARCTKCHLASNEIFSDFKNYRLAVPQLAPVFGAGCVDHHFKGCGNVPFDGLDANEDFGREQISGDPDDRYKFRTSPLRNVAVQPAFFHDGAFTRLEDAIRHHLNARQSALSYNPVRAGVDADLRHVGPIQNILALPLDPLLKKVKLSSTEFLDLVAFVRDGLLDPRAKPENLCLKVLKSVPSGLRVATFQGCPH